MKRLWLLLLSFSVAAGAADLADVHSVYVLHMSHGLDQFLASHLTNDHVFRVVTDPKLADAFLTDHIGASFEAQMAELLPDPAPPKKADPPPPDPKAPAAQQSTAAMMADPDNKRTNMVITSSFGNNKGAIFLVNSKSKEVVWSAFEPPKSSESKELNRTASDIVSRIKKDLNPSAKK